LKRKNHKALPFESKWLKSRVSSTGLLPHATSPNGKVDFIHASFLLLK